MQVMFFILYVEKEPKLCFSYFRYTFSAKVYKILLKSCLMCSKSTSFTKTPDFALQFFNVQTGFFMLRLRIEKEWNRFILAILLKFSYNTFITHAEDYVS